jgi:tRNA threonylcarbamoyladenosine biosynthesis protein TsaB
MALWRDGVVTSTSGTDPRSHAERLPLEAMEWLALHGAALDTIDVFVVVAGPGSFTGLRVGVACVQGWAFALDRRVIAVPTLDAVAAAGPGVSDDAVIVPCVDGQRGEVFFAARYLGAEIVPPAVGKPEDMLRAVTGVAAGRSVLATGDGAVKYAAALEASGWRQAPSVVPLSEAAVRLAADRLDQAAPAASVQLIYIRKTDAELTRDRAKQLR